MEFPVVCIDQLVFHPQQTDGFVWFEGAISAIQGHGTGLKLYAFERQRI